VQIDSLMAPPIGAVGTNQGTLAVQVNNRDGLGVQNIMVTIKHANGTVTLSEPTNAVGCAVFAYIPVGSYDVNVNQAGGWVTPEGVTDVHVSGIVSNGTTNAPPPIVYDVAGTVTMNMRTRYFDAQANAIVDGPSRAYNFGLANPGVTSTGYRQFAPTPTPATSLTATKLFPFKDAYGLYSGRCLSPENPGLANGGAVQIVDRAGIYTANVYQPALRIKVIDSSKSGSPPVVGANVVATLRSTATGCLAPTAGDKNPGVTTDTLGLMTYNGTAGDARNGFITRPPTTDIPLDPGIPYGNWDICVASGGKTKSFTNYSNRAMNGATSTTTYDFSGATNGSCAP
jgi:hypothetical protein